MANEVAIIGAGIAGLTLALSLHTQDIPCAIYETRPEPQNIGGAVMLSPNSLRLFDGMGVYNDLKHHGFSFDTLYFRDLAGDLKETYPFGSVEKYGYSGLRVYRFQLIDLLLEKINANKIPIYFNHKFSHVVSESTDTVTWKFIDGTEKTSSLLIGADGIHSRVRKYMYPDLSPKFTGLAGITAAVPTANLKLPSPDYAMPVTIMSPTHGAFVIAPQKPDGSEVLIGKQKRMPELSREGWDQLYADKEAAVAFLREGSEVFGDIAVSATSDIPHAHINIWPFYIIPKLDSWSSTHRRVLLVGDSAHAIPPSSGQGISQAVEDVVMLAMLLGRGRSEKKDLGWWQEVRQARLQDILLLNARVDKRRLPKIMGLDEEDDAEKGFDLDWLYGLDVVSVVEEYVGSS
ncbi:FAD/NAD(P)-binding domain-containing protein [Aureobasidium pullulans]|uniref:FAD/NAD(P)-binding domain-containing protein n=1 Tax=Aureobasidium pullulans TaxID=5580 RepID=A0A4T0C9F0_AURPU|nr:FAD/NAD(P)-binding domain-containing protein [Aureobasidium pullulans]TIA44256.1 FAD/NAD(P)-binding domain-containing protein [Aureobasidium pullulans]TIA74491.1 FAD/NAD(P)-binding domain-containing protein [Aureobasidium pullulans]